jgi:septal ring factor EnvC (AmiA/AmiB activator)
VVRDAPQEPSRISILCGNATVRSEDLTHHATGKMPYTLMQAAEATRKSKSTILRSIQSGKLSALRDELTQGWLIEPAELHRLYPPVAHDAANAPALAHHATQPEIEELRREVAHKDELLALEQRERRRDHETIDELRRQLAATDEERRTTLRQLTALLTDQREKPEPPRRRWFSFGKR